MIDHIIFDFNGTLFNDEEFHFQAWDQVIQELTGQRLTQEILNNMTGKNNKQIVQMIKNDISDQQNEYYSLYKEELYRKIVLNNPDKMHLSDGAITLFEQLKELNIPFNIASASILENIEFFIKIFELDKWFDPTKIIYDNGDYLDKQQMFIDASKNINCDVNNALVFEDSKSGIKWAKNVGATVIAIGDNSKETLYKQLGVISIINDFTNFNLKSYINM